MSLAIYESVTNRIIEALEQGVVPWRKPWHAEAKLPINALYNRPYRGVNVLLLALSPYRDHRWLTFQQASQLGGNVKLGEKATTVVFWKQWECTETDPYTGDVKKKRIPILKTFAAFNAEQCEGVQLPELEVETITPNERIERAESLVRSMPSPPTIKEQGTAAWYRPKDDLVHIPPLDRFQTADAFYSTLFHELGHATGHETRLNRTGVAGDIVFGSGSYGHEELVAELCAAFCAATASLDHSLIENSASYINSWLRVIKGDPKLVVIAAAQAQKAADYIFGVQRPALTS